MTLPPLLLLTRPDNAAHRFWQALQQAGCGEVSVLVSPLIGIAPCGVMPAGDVAGLVFTSAQGVMAWAARGGVRDLPAYCVGDATAEAARATGMLAHAAGGDADALFEMLRDMRPPVPLLHVRGRYSRGALATRLTAAGVLTNEAVLYDQPVLPPTEAALRALRGQRPVVAPLFSPRTAEALAEIGPKSPLLVAALSEAVAKPVAGLHSLALKQALRPDANAMVDLTLALLDEARALERLGSC